MDSTPSVRRRLLLGVFVVSGFTGLIYESIWSHYLKLFLGHAAYAQTLVLSIFMGGLALGSWLVACYSRRIRQLLLGYLLVEGVLGVLGIAFHRSFIAVSDLSFTSIIPALHSGFLIQLYKWSVAATLILPQSTLLGMTFPLISGGIIRRWPERSGETLSVLYFTNSLGASLGVLVSGFLLISLVGLPGTVLTAGLLNVLLALLVWLIIRSDPEPPSPAASLQPRAADRLQTWFLVAAFATGAASFLYELGWIRMLSLVLGSSTHAFELMLSAFIFGLACGGLYVRKRVERIQDPVRTLGSIMMLMGGLALLTVPSYNRTFDVMAWALHIFTRTPDGYTGFNVASQAIAAAIMIPTTFCAGMTLPLLTHALLRRDHSERAIGAIYAANTLGAIAGVLVTVHLLMPQLGVKGVIIAGATIHMGLGVSGLLLRRASALRVGAVAVGCAAAIALVLFGVSLDPLRMASGVYRSGNASLPADGRVHYLRDGKTATITVVEHDGIFIISTNGKPDAAIQMGSGEVSVDEITMILAAALPLSMHPHPARVANIGFGSGLTTHTLLGSDRVKWLDSVEIEPFVVQAARQAYQLRIHNVFEDARSHLIYEDAKTFFATVHEPYDLIVSEPSNPWVSGVATLFSDEFYRHISRYLRPDGYFVQWVQIYESDMSVVSSVIKAMSPHFGAYALYNTDDINVLIVATPATTLPAPNAWVFQSPLLRSELARVGIASLADIEHRRIGDRQTLGPLFWSWPAPVNSDFFPFVDLNAPRLRYEQRSAFDLPNLTSLPVPLVELVGGRMPAATTVPPPSNSTVLRDVMVRRALAIRDATATGRLKDDKYPFLPIDLLTIDAPAARCADPMIQRAWQSAVRQISDFTTTYLGQKDLEGIWHRILSSPCYQTKGLHSTWADLMAALAQRDTARVSSVGETLLGLPRSTVSDDEKAFVLTAVAAADISSGNLERARTLLESVSAGIKVPPTYSFALRDLLALSRVSDVANSGVLADTALH
jgi:spermidine synthase